MLLKKKNLKKKIKKNNDKKKINGFIPGAKGYSCNL